MNHLFKGDIWLAISVNPANPNPHDSTEYDFLMINTGNTGFFACCSTIRTINPTWDGRVWITAIPIADSYFDLTLYRKSCLNYILAH